MVNTLHVLQSLICNLDIVTKSRKLEILAAIEIFLTIKL